MNNIKAKCSSACRQPRGACTHTHTNTHTHRELYINSDKTYFYIRCFRPELSVVLGVAILCGRLAYPLVNNEFCSVSSEAMCLFTDLLRPHFISGCLEAVDNILFNHAQSTGKILLESGQIQSRFLVVRLGI